MSPPGELLAWSTWYRQQGKRWPMLIGTYIGLALAVFTTLTGYGWKLAEQRLPGSRAAVIARNQPKIPEEQNAAVLYDRAVVAMVAWNSISPESADGSPFDPNAPDNLKDEGWRKPETFSANKPLRAYLQANTEAMRLADEGAQRRAIDWGIANENYPAAKIDRITNARALVRLITQDALVAANDGKWALALARFQTTTRISQHLRTTVGFMPQLIAGSIDSMVAIAIARSLMVPGATPDQGTVQTFLRMASEANVERIDDYLKMLADEELLNLHIMDQVASGDVSFLSDGAPQLVSRTPSYMSLYAIAYPWDRAAMLDLSHDLRDGLLAKKNGIPITRTLRDCENSMRTDPRLVYPRLIGASLTGLLMPVSGLGMTFERQRQVRWRILELALHLDIWIHREGRFPTTWNQAGIGETAAADVMALSKPQPLQFRREVGGLLRVWSIGNNGKDDTTAPSQDRFAHNDDPTVLLRLPEDTP